MKIKILLLCWLSPFLLKAQSASPAEQEITINKFISGSLLVPAAAEKPPLVILIQGSGPTDRDGNQPFLKNNSLKMLARALADKGIASYRYDKRIRKALEMGTREEEMRFDDFITDAVSVLDYFNEVPKFEKIIVLGHSQGSLVGMIAAKDKADAFISIAGAGRAIDSILVDQVAQQVPSLRDNAIQAYKEIRETGRTESYNPLLGSLFRPSIQPFMASWIKYDPAEELQKLKIPVLLINGNNDIQVPVSEAELLKERVPGTELVVLEDMNHILKEFSSQDLLENTKTYNDPSIPLHPELAPTIVKFITGLQ